MAKTNEKKKTQAKDTQNSKRATPSAKSGKSEAGKPTLKTQKSSEKRTPPVKALTPAKSTKQKTGRSRAEVKTEPVQTIYNPDGTLTRRQIGSKTRTTTSTRDGVKTTVREHIRREEIVTAPIRSMTRNAGAKR